MAEHSISIRLGLDGASKVVKALNDAGVNGSKALDRIANASKPASRWMQALSATAGEVGARMEGLAGRIGVLAPSLAAFGPIGIAVGAGLAAIGVGALGAVAITKRLTESVVETSATFEKFGSILETTEGSSAKARVALDWVAKFAKDTPYEVGEVTESFVKLRAYGLDPTKGLLRTLGDTASAMGKPINQAVEAIADAVTGENERLKEFGIKASKAHGKITYEYTQNGKQMTKVVDANNRKMIESTLTAIFNSKYEGAMDKLSKTWSGRISTLNDTWTNFKRKIGDSGAFDALKGILEKIQTYLDQLAKSGTLDRLAKAIGGALATAFGDVGKAIDDMIARQGGIEAFANLIEQKIGEVAQSFRGVIDAIKSVGDGFSAISKFNEDSKSWAITRGMNWLARGGSSAPAQSSAISQAPSSGPMYGPSLPSASAAVPSAIPPARQQVGVGGSVDINVRGPGDVRRVKTRNPGVPINVNQGLSLGHP